jgi:hypothetical protein
VCPARPGRSKSSSLRRTCRHSSGPSSSDTGSAPAASRAIVAAMPSTRGAKGWHPYCV